MDFDVIVIGGGAAGLSAATVLARQRRSVLVVDEGRPRNARAEGVHAFLGHDGRAPADLLAAGREEVLRYGGAVRTGRATGASRDVDAFAVGLDDGTTVTARKLIVTTGAVDELPDIDGVAAEWGHGVVHCPFCHGWEVRDQAIGVLVTGPMSLHQAQLFRQLSDDVIVFANGHELSDDDRLPLTARGIAVVDGPVRALCRDDGRVTGVELATGRVVPRTAVVVASRVRADSAVPAVLGVEVVEHPSGAGTHYPTGPHGQTAVPGLRLAGNLVDPSAQVVDAAAAGKWAGAMTHAELMGEEVAAAVAAHRADFDVERATEGRYWDTWYSQRARLWSGHVNAQVAAEVGDLAPGRALDVGCGEGGDALWLAEHGWDVTGVDVSEVVLQRAATEAAARGLDVTFEVHDVMTWAPPTRAFDLVSAQFLHLPGLDRRAVYGRLADAVAPGGTLLVVGHDVSDVETAHRPDAPEMFFTAEDLVADLGDGWTVLVAEHRPRVMVHEGEEVQVLDVVLRAVRA